MNGKIISILILIIGTIAIWHLGFFNRYNYLTAKSDIANKNIQLVYIGESKLKPKDLNRVSKKYGFKIVGFGCALTTNEQNGIEMYNSQIDHFLGEYNGVGWKSEYKKEIDSLLKLTNIPKTAFWVEKDEIGYWYNIDWIHSHKNMGNISIYNHYGDLHTKGHFFMICPSEEFQLMDDLENQIDFYDGKNIQLKSNCYLMKRK
ncbi:MAG: hypothetical protein BM564_00730 [Bacteroidetes bacterium MedPE-SWsnd-G2]|nr:MAG: hypothetical protein BM564_00730 [Bacteroidetes bacterium MedPE-SWsnd-G2]